MPSSPRSSDARRYRTTDFGAARRSLQVLATTLDTQHPGAAASLRERLEETLTVVRLGLSPSLQRTLRERWTVACMLEAGKRFHRVQGYRGIPALRAAFVLVWDGGALASRAMGR